MNKKVLLYKVQVQGNETFMNRKELLNESDLDCKLYSK